MEVPITHSEFCKPSDQIANCVEEKPMSPLGDVPTVETLKELNRLRMTGALCDAVLGTEDGAKFRVHKVAMSWCSSYFRTLFTTSLVDRSSGEGPRTKTYFAIPNVSSTVLETIIRYAYSGLVNVNKENVNNLLPAADQFNVVGVVDECIHFMLQNMTPENCVGIWRFGKEYYMQRLEKEARRFILAHFVDVSIHSEEFPHLRMRYLKDLLKDDDLNVPNELLVWIAIKRWCQYKYANRHRFIPILLPCVRLALLPAADFQQIMDDPRVYRDIQCRTYINMVSKFILRELEDVSKLLQNKNIILMFTPRHPYDIIFSAGGWSVYGPTNVLEVYDCQANLWKMIFIDNFEPRSYHQSIPLGDYIYVLGGSNTQESLNSCFRIDTRTLNKEDISPMQQRRCYLSAVILAGTIYAIGGYDGLHRLQTVEYFDPARNQWAYVSPMNEKRSDASASSLRDRIFVVGGFNGEQFLQSAECYFSDFDQWFSLPPMLNCRSGVGSVALDDCIYAIGGYDGARRLKSVEKYCVKDRQWLPTKPMKMARSNFGIAIINRKIYVMGGYNDEVDSTTDQSEYFDPDKPQWLSVAPLNVGRSGFSACTLSGIRDITPYVKDDRFRCLLKNTSKEDSVDLE